MNLTILKIIINWLIKNYKLFIIGISILFILLFMKQCSQISKQKIEIDRLQSNIEYYQQLSDTTINSNKTLRLTVEELTNNKDSLIQRINRLADSLKIKPKEIKVAYSITTQLRDTIKDTIPSNNINFNKTLILNSLTKITVIRNNENIWAIPDIRNNQTLFIEEKRRYKYNNFFKRLFKLNFKKITNYNYQIINTNDKIKNIDSRVITIITQ